MPLQDLTPQLRTRLNRMEKAVGWFVFIATALLVFGFGYYLYHTAERKGWFKIKAPFFTYVKSSAGLNVKDPVMMMGFQVGEITSIHAMPPRDSHNVRVEFEIVDPYFRYLWTGGSVAKVNAADLLGKRQLEVTRGTNGYALVVTQPVSVHTLDEASNLMTVAPGQWQLAQDITNASAQVLFNAYMPLEQVFDPTNAALLATGILESNLIYIYNNTVNRDRVVGSWDGRYRHYKIFQPGDEVAWLRSVEAPPVSDQIQAMVSQVQAALPGILALTNKISAVLDNAADATSNLNTTVVAAQPMVTNFALISTQLRDPGGLTQWALGTNGNAQFQGTLTNLNGLLANADTNLARMSDQITLSLTSLANITSNLNVQVQSNSNLLGNISKIIVDTDDFVQGLKRHWLLRSAFKKENAQQNASTNTSPSRLMSPRDASNQ